MIKKIPVPDFADVELLSKINEIIDVVNKLQKESEPVMATNTTVSTRRRRKDTALDMNNNNL